VVRLAKILVLAGASCGQMYGNPTPQAQPAQPQGEGPPGGGADPWREGDLPSMAARPDDPGPGAPASRNDIPTPPARPAGSGLDAEAQQLLDSHNRYRAQHCAQPLTWSPRLAKAAQLWANTLKAQGCAFEHSGGPTGENLAAGTTGALDAKATVAMWYDEIKGYSFEQPGFSMQTGHFTQVVWRGTTAVGCGKSQCKGMDVWVCEYDPPGNWEGQYRQQVLPIGCK
jgi:uncharacterized protein YkwD